MNEAGQESHAQLLAGDRVIVSEEPDDVLVERVRDGDRAGGPGGPAVLPADVRGRGDHYDLPGHRALASGNPLRLSDPLLDLALAAALPGQPQALYRTADAALQERFGHRLFTLLAYQPGSGEVERLYSSRPEAYPLAGRKLMGPTPWGARVLHRGEPYLGRTAEDLRWAFPDHELIASLGLGCILNRPVAWDGRVLGVPSLLQEGEHRYDEADLEAAAPYAALLLPGLLTTA